MQPFTQSNDLLGQPEALRRRAAEDGYLFFRDLLPRQSVLDLRLQILHILDRQGLIRRGFPLDEAVADLDTIAALPSAERGYCGVGVPREVYLEVQKLEAFHRLPHHPRLIALYRDLLGGEVFPHPRHICRLMLPGPTVSPTPPHQDYVHIQGTQHTWTCWFPIGDCPLELGSLAVLAGSHGEGILPVHEAEGAGGLASWLCNMTHEWTGNGFRAGDILTFPSLTVHKGLPNQANRQVRLSFDARFQRVDEPVNQRSLKPHCELAAWEEIYTGWQDDSLRYYWEKLPLIDSEWDASLTKSKEKIC